jgi:excisionase family DNA binding protein
MSSGIFGDGIVTKLLSVEGAAELLSISKWTVRSYIRDGKLQPVRIGRRVLLAETELERFVAESQGPKAASPSVAASEVQHD